MLRLKKHCGYIRGRIVKGKVYKSYYNLRNKELNHRVLKLIAMFKENPHMVLMS